MFLLGIVKYGCLQTPICWAIKIEILLILVAANFRLKLPLTLVSKSTGLTQKVARHTIYSSDIAMSTLQIEPLRKFCLNNEFGSLHSLSETAEAIA
jgi:hypothetical protein